MDLVHNTTAEYQAREQACQQVMDYHYNWRGHEIISREGTREYDLVIRNRGYGEPEKVEEQFRSQFYGDLLIELMQDIPTRKQGWYYETRCDYLHYVVCPAWEQIEYYYRLNWRRFRKWMESHYFRENNRPHMQTSIQGYGTTLNICVPVSAIPPLLYTRIEVGLALEDFA